MKDFQFTGSVLAVYKKAQSGLPKFEADSIELLEGLGPKLVTRK